MSVIQFEPLYTVREVSRILKVNMGAVYKEMNAGRLPYILLGSKKVKGMDLEKYIQTYPYETNEGGEDNQ